MGKNVKGFTLVEAIVTIIIIAITSVVVLEFFVKFSTIIKQSELKFVAANFARETIEELYLKSYSDTALNPITDADDGLPVMGGINGSPAGLLRDVYGGTRAYSIVQGTNYKVITATVRWRY